MKKEKESKLIEQSIKLYNFKGMCAVVDWGNELNLPFFDCEPCEANTPFIGDVCAVCGTYKKVKEEKGV